VSGIDHDAFGGAHDALNRMKRASERGTGCHLTADMIAALSVTILDQMWGEEDPRRARATHSERPDQ
jgi:hypothetical protein